MPGLRYGFDITDDAAQTLDILERAQARVRNPQLSAAERQQAKQLLKDAQDRIKTTFGNMRTARMFADQKGEFGEAGTVTLPNGKEVNARNALSKAAHQAYKRLEERGRVRGMSQLENGAVKYGSTIMDRSGSTAASRRLAGRAPEIAGRPAQEAARASTYKATREAAASRPNLTTADARELNRIEGQAAQRSRGGTQRKRNTRARRSQGR